MSKNIKNSECQNVANFCNLYHLLASFSQFLSTLFDFGIMTLCEKAVVNHNGNRPLRSISVSRKFFADFITVMFLCKPFLLLYIESTFQKLFSNSCLQNKVVIRGSQIQQCFCSGNMNLNLQTIFILQFMQ